MVEKWKMQFRKITQIYILRFSNICQRLQNDWILFKIVVVSWKMFTCSSRLLPTNGPPSDPCLFHTPSAILSSIAYEIQASSTSIIRSFPAFFQISKLISLLRSLFACPQTGRQTDTKCKQLSSNSHAYADRHHTHHTKPRQFKHISKLTMEGNRVLFIVVVVVTGIRAAITKFFLIISCSFNWKWEILEMENGEK